MNLYKTTQGNLLHVKGTYYGTDQDWDKLINRDNLYGYLNERLESMDRIDEAEALTWIAQGVLPPVGSQEVWAAGVTYFRSMEARMEEAKD